MKSKKLTDTKTKFLVLHFSYVDFYSECVKKEINTATHWSEGGFSGEYSWTQTDPAKK
jgi:hypothetical protein